MMERDHHKKLSGFIELDDAYLGGQRTGCKPGRGAAGKTPFVAAVETTDQRCPVRIKLSVVKGFRSNANQVMESATSDRREYCYNRWFGVLQCGCRCWLFA